ncbi:spore coat polysaccharide biosynthesis protein spsF [Paramagnetospirillum magnetotacticum MS-1]|uniref:Spore coat polysaccharide biosynthesis protein spsF n=1 Tax=Paramagnetospirillum magnetotacticum MS-1 TaxID=272627 RepID=A0A0C2V264_PARME|nr:glycosyltransferase family protein [Paramagnetospirillum magnetotacticum]KIL99151.1 spore coat polysaccharide biosynthesis protein spsF [Paramagnetospirillum magnetotacticum MS-1]
MTAAVIVQARMGSTRLPGKILMPLGGMSALAQCLRRCASIPGIDRVVCAIPEGEDEAPVVAEAIRCGALVARGPSADVLKRYALAAELAEADVVMRVTSDCPLLDPDLCGNMLAKLKTEGLDFCCNNTPPSWPHGLDAEVFTRALLMEADRTATEPFEREHVTPWMRKASHVKRGNIARIGADLSLDCRWTLDYPEDYAFLAALFERLPEEIVPTQAVLAVLAAHPELAEINAMHHGVRAKPPTK